MRTIEGRRLVRARPEEIFAFLSRLENHWTLADRWIRVLELDSPPERSAGAQAGRVRLRGPLGIGRTVRTRVLASDPPRALSGAAEIGRRTRARVRWELSARDRSTLVTLKAEIESLGPLDRALFALGALPWLRRRFESVLDDLERRFGSERSRGDRFVARPRPS